ncbi:Nitrogen permease regulator 2 [Saitoella coloradoensis]
MAAYKSTPSDFPPRLVAIFFAVFDPQLGPHVLHQVPSASIHPHSPSAIFDFEALSEYIIPKPQLCSRLIQICSRGYRVLGWPICMVDKKYERNALMFNLCCVFEEGADSSCYVSIVRRLNRVFKRLEEQNAFISNPQNALQIHNIIEQVFEDLNNYCECMIPINDANTINLKLFPSYPQPPAVKAYHVPILTVRLEALMDVNWDLTMQKVIPFIDGMNSVRRISDIADVDYVLAKKCMEHLLYYGCLLMTDIFQFSNVYAPTPLLENIVTDPSLQHECQAYVSSHGPSSAPKIPFARLFELYCSLRQGTRLKEWMEVNEAKLEGIDVRRFVSFGCIKGILYRVRRYPVLEEGVEGSGGGGGGSGRKGVPLMRYLDGTSTFDEIATDLQCPPAQIEKALKGYDRTMQYIYR